MIEQQGLFCLRANIVTLQVDAIVNAANGWLESGGGVCGAIHDAAGAELEQACKELGGCPTGEARITPGFRLPARFVIHAVGPDCRERRGGEDAALASAYVAAMALAAEHGCRSVAFPSLSTGIYGFPLEAATRIAVRTLREGMAEFPGVERVVMACFDELTLKAFQGQGVRVEASA